MTNIIGLQDILMYKALRPHYEGVSYYDLLKTNANTMRMYIFYCAETTKFNWQRFLDIHLEAHRMFNDIGEPLSDSIKILCLKGWFHPEAGLELSMEVAKGLPDMRDSFDKYTNRFTESVINRRGCLDVLKLATQTLQESVNTGRL